MSSDENKGREDAFSKDVSVVLEEEEQELLKEEKNETENHLPNKETTKKKYKSEKSVKFLFREATKARNEHVYSMNSTKGKVAELVLRRVGDEGRFRTRGRGGFFNPGFERFRADDDAKTTTDERRRFVYE